MTDKLKEELNNVSIFRVTSNTREDELHRFIKSVERLYPRTLVLVIICRYGIMITIQYNNININMLIIIIVMIKLYLPFST